MKMQPGNTVLKKQGTKEFHYMTYDEALKLRYGDRVFCEGIKGYINVKINGAVKTWKTRPQDLRIPLKYGMYEYAYAEMKDGQWTQCGLLVDEHGTINR